MTLVGDQPVVALAPREDPYRVTVFYERRTPAEGASDIRRTCMTVWAQNPTHAMHHLQQRTAQHIAEWQVSFGPLGISWQLPRER